MTALGATDSIAIYEQGGTTTSNYPIQIGRPFVDGEISNCPQAIVGGTPVTTQANVTQNYADGSVKHAIISFLIPMLAANSNVTVTFQNQASCNTTALTLAQMQSSSYNFGAQIKLTNGSTITADALTMLNAGAYAMWTPGQVAQTVLIADDGQETTCGGKACSNYDFGFDAYKVIRPRFYVTFWPTINKVTVRFVAEIPNSQAVEDQTYSADLYYGNTNPTRVCDWGSGSNSCPSASFTHNALARWTKRGYWIGGAPSTVAIDHNLSYLSSTSAIPNYDTTKGTGLAAQESSSYAAWNAISHDPFNAYSCGEGSCGGLWATSMLGTGDRLDLGLYTGWVMNWLYTMNDYRNAAIAFGQADLSASWPIYMREGVSGNNITGGTSTPTPACTYQCNVGGLGKPASIVSRPTLAYVYGPLGGSGGAASVGTVGSSPWLADNAHLPDNWTVPYLLTGDYFYLEESNFWAGWLAGWITPNGANYQRPSTGNIAAAYQGQTRAVAWTLRSMANAWAIAPDNTPEKSYIETSLNQMMATDEGMHGITGTPYQGTTAWSFGNTTVRYWVVESGATIDQSASPLHEWASGTFSLANDELALGNLLSFTGAGTLSTSGSSTQVTFSNSADCSSIPVGAIFQPSSGSSIIGYNAIIAKNCPTATMLNAMSLSAAPFQWADTADSDGGPWMQSFLMMSLGRVKEVFGSAGEPIVAWYSKLFTDALTNPSYNPYLTTAYRSPQISASLAPNNWVPDLATKKALFSTAYQNLSTWAFAGYAEILVPAVAYIAGEKNGAAAWNFVNTNEFQVDPFFATDTRWAVLPRSATTTTQLNSCDLNSDGVVNSIDVQIAINQTVGAAACTNAILDGGTTCTIVDVQRVATAATTGVCRVGN